MQWLLELGTEKDPISLCRLMNIFRRKGVNLVTLSLASETAEFSLRAVVETAESEVAHIFNFLRRTEGVQHVTCYRHEPSESASARAGVAGNGMRNGAGGVGDGLAGVAPQGDASLIIHASRPDNGLDEGAEQNAGRNLDRELSRARIA
jgi:hypothetical protein